MDRRICRICKHSGFQGKGSGWTGCTYIIDTGEKRPHDGDMCYGFEPVDEKAAKTAAKLLKNMQKTAEKAQKPEIPAPVSVYDGFRTVIHI